MPARRRCSAVPTHRSKTPNNPRKTGWLPGAVARLRLAADEPRVQMTKPFLVAEIPRFGGWERVVNSKCLLRWRGPLPTLHTCPIAGTEAQRDNAFSLLGALPFRAARCCARRPALVPVMTAARRRWQPIRAAYHLRPRATKNRRNSSRVAEVTNAVSDGNRGKIMTAGSAEPRTQPRARVVLWDSAR